MPKRANLFLVILGIILTISLVLLGYIVTQNRTSQQGRAGTVDSIIINNGDEIANNRLVSLALTTKNDPQTTQMRIGNSLSDVYRASPVMFQSTYSWTLPPGDGRKTVYVQFKDELSDWFTPLGDDICSNRCFGPSPTAKPTDVPYNTPIPSPTGTGSTAWFISFNCGQSDTYNLSSSRGCIANETLINEASLFCSVNDRPLNGYILGDCR